LEEILWQETRNVRREELSMSPSGFAIPVSFSIPCGARETEINYDGNETTWIVHARGKLDGVDYNSHFSVPVYAVKESELISIDKDAAPAPIAPDDGSTERKRSRPSIRVRSAKGGGTEFYFGALRSPEVALFLGVFLAIYFGGYYSVIYFKKVRPDIILTII
ncbi:MAG: hypothetical protein GTO08_03615, partial [Deltaproteobacteria bacterium]|nr:hypothetical protein [Deltaproteobacteria bacterium]